LKLQKSSLRKQLLIKVDKVKGLVKAVTEILSAMALMYQAKPPHQRVNIKRRTKLSLREKDNLRPVKQFRKRTGGRRVRGGVRGKAEKNAKNALSRMEFRVEKLEGNRGGRMEDETRKRMTGETAVLHSSDEKARNIRCDDIAAVTRGSSQRQKKTVRGEAEIAKRFQTGKKTQEEHKRPVSTAGEGHPQGNKDSVISSKAG